MNLTEFIRQNNIKSVDGEDFAQSPEFYKIRQFEQTCHTIRGVPFLEPETYQVREFDVTLRGSVQENWDRQEKKNKRLFFVERVFNYPGSSEGLETVEDAVPAGQSVDEALAALEAAGCAEVSIAAMPENEGAQRLYRSLGLVDEAVYLEKHF